MDSNNSLVTVDEMAQILKVPKSWLYGRTRFGAEKIPHIKFGKYIRFNSQEVLEFFKNKEKTKE